MVYPRGVVAVADAIHVQGYDSHTAPPPLVLNIAGEVLKKIKYGTKKPEAKAVDAPKKPPRIRAAKPEPKPKAEPEPAKPESKPEPKPEAKVEEPKPAAPATEAPKRRRKKAETPAPVAAKEDVPAAPPAPPAAEKPKRVRAKAAAGEPPRRKAVRPPDTEAKRALERAAEAAKGQEPAKVPDDERVPYYYPFTVCLSLMLTTLNILELSDTEAGNDSRKKKVTELVGELNKLKARPVLLPADMKPYLEHAESAQQKA